MELRMQIEDQYIKNLQSALDARATDVVREALTILNWAIEERRRGRLILSTNEKGLEVARLAMPSLDKVAKRS